MASWSGTNFVFGYWSVHGSQRGWATLVGRHILLLLEVLGRVRDGLHDVSTAAPLLLLLLADHALELVRVPGEHGAEEALLRQTLALSLDVRGHGRAEHLRLLLEGHAHHERLLRVLHAARWGRRRLLRDHGLRCRRLGGGGERPELH